MCLFSLILASGLGSLASGPDRTEYRPRLPAWGAVVVVYLVIMERVLPVVFQATTGRERPVRIAGGKHAAGFSARLRIPPRHAAGGGCGQRANPVVLRYQRGMGVLASVLGVMLSMSFGLAMTVLISVTCYLLLIPSGFALLCLPQRMAHTEAAPARTQPTLQAVTF